MNRFDGKSKIAVLILILMTFTPASLISASVKAATVESQMISPEENASTSREIDELKVRRALENKLVAEKLMSHGLTKEEVSAKLNQMSDEQVHQMASLADRIPAGGNGAIGIVIALLVIFALVLLIIFLYKRV
ncbi:MAG TPA: PA2779 family protein [Thermodesulfobacteriota bacterium]|nr:PA2779 family protein [Thermodesulfobacteriota bacterium]